MQEPRRGSSAREPTISCALPCPSSNKARPHHAAPPTSHAPLVWSPLHTLVFIHPPLSPWAAAGPSVSLLRSLPYRGSVSLAKAQPGPRHSPALKSSMAPLERGQSPFLGLAFKDSNQSPKPLVSAIPNAVSVSGPSFYLHSPRKLSLDPTFSTRCPYRRSWRWSPRFWSADLTFIGC